MSRVSEAKKELVRQALKDGNGKVAKAIKVARENGVPPKDFGALVREGLSRVDIGGNTVDLLYGKRVDGIKFGGKISDVDGQIRWLQSKTTEWVREETMRELAKEEYELRRKEKLRCRQ